MLKEALADASRSRICSSDALWAKTVFGSMNVKIHRRGVFWFGGALIGSALLIVPVVSPDGAARAAIALCDEVDIEPIVTRAMDEPEPSPPPVLAFRGEQLRRVRSLLEVRDERGFACLCSGDYRLRFSRWHVPLASFRGHLREDPAQLVGSFGIITLNSTKAHQLRAWLRSTMKKEARN